MARIALIGDNSKEYVKNLLDIWCEGDSAVLIDWKIPERTAYEMMKDAGVFKCRIDKELFDKWNSTSFDDIAFFTYEKAGNPTDFLPDNLYDNFPENYENKEAAIFYSSGTTGKSKGIILTHYAINTNADAIINYMNPGPSDCLYIVKNMAHSSTIVGELLVALKTKTKLVISPTFVLPRYILGNIKKYNISIICINPTLLRIYSQEFLHKNIELPFLRTIYVSGSILDKGVYNLAHEAFGNAEILNMYGLSEAGPRVSVQSEGTKNTVGKALAGVRLKIIKEDGNLARQGETGTIFVKTPSLFSGYVLSTNEKQISNDGWLNTGDVGYFDADSDLVILGRSDDCFMYRSHKICPEEIENILCSYGVFSECLICGNDLSIKCYYTTPQSKVVSEADWTKERKEDFTKFISYVKSLPDIEAHKENYNESELVRDYKPEQVLRAAYTINRDLLENISGFEKAIN